MSGAMTMRVHFDDRRVRRALKNMDDAGTKGLVKVFRRLRVPLQKQLREHADRESGPDGGWPARAAATEAKLKRRGHATRTTTVRARRRRGHSGPRRETQVTTTYRNVLGGLPMSVGVSTERRGPAIVARSSGALSVAHNEGAVVGRGARVPARPFVFIPRRFADDDVLPAVVAHVHSAWSKA